ARRKGRRSGACGGLFEGLRDPGGHARDHRRVLCLLVLLRNSGGGRVRCDTGDRVGNESVHVGRRVEGGLRLGGVGAWGGGVGVAFGHFGNLSSFQWSGPDFFLLFYCSFGWRQAWRRIWILAWDCWSTSPCRQFRFEPMEIRIGL